MTEGVPVEEIKGTMSLCHERPVRAKARDRAWRVAKQIGHDTDLRPDVPRHNVDLGRQEL